MVEPFQGSFCFNGFLFSRDALRDPGLRCLTPSAYFHNDPLQTIMTADVQIPDPAHKSLAITRPQRGPLF
ncbi:MAG: hypothetical protein D6814_09645 [Calditrichaeota bacterium]|nr:MAG: hypothetical protein D6814_09645 [Calditrichota bacterium]